MNTLLKSNLNRSSLVEGFKIFNSVLFSTHQKSLNLTSSSQNQHAVINLNLVRNHYTFNIKGNIRYRRATRPKKTSNESIALTYEQAQFAEKIGVTKSWNSWNTCKLNILYETKFSLSFL
jgi:hypothetical protein